MPKVRLQDPVSEQEAGVSVSVTACPPYFTPSTEVSRVSVFCFLWLSEMMDELGASWPVVTGTPNICHRFHHMHQPWQKCSGGQEPPLFVTVVSAGYVRASSVQEQ